MSICRQAVFLCMLLGFATEVVASEASRQLTLEGIGLLKAGKFGEAVLKFEFATRSDRNDPEAHFFLGVGFNRLGSSSEALTWIRRARIMGYANPEMDLEEGVALVGLQDYRAALEPLGRYEEANPEHGLVRELLGRAYFGLAEYDRAESFLKAAVQRDRLLADMANLLLALVAQERDRDAGAVGRYFCDVLRRDPTTRLTTAIHDQAAAGLGCLEEEKPWWIILSAGGGYNSNVIALGDGIPLPADISSQDAGFGRATLDASYRWRLTPSDSLTVGYSFQADVFERALSSFDLLDHYFYGDLQHLLPGDLSLGLRLSDEFTQIGGDSFRNQVTVRPSLAYRVTTWAVTELAYAFSTADYFFGALAVQDRDSRTHTVSLTGRLAVPGTRLQAGLGYYFSRNNADGADFDFSSHALWLSLEHPLPLGSTGELFYSHSFDDYDNPNSLAGPAGFAFARDDDVDRLTVRITVPVVESLELYLRYDFTNDDSNVAVFDFVQHVGSAGVIARF